MSYLLNKKKQKIAYKRIKGRSPGLVFIHGLNSDMNGLKAIRVEKYARKNKLAFIRFDCRGHGNSFGNFENFTISDWKKDLLDIIDNLTKGPQILIGSSMGGWLMILAAKSRPKKIVGLMGLAAAIDFGKDLFENLNTKNKKEIKQKGITRYTSSGFSYLLTNNFFVQAEKNKILEKSFKFKKPIILLHGTKDGVVGINMPKKIMEVASGDNVQVIYLKSSDHRLSSPSDLISIDNGINNIRALL
jgi:alpha-beta hydrolase superfamily lysophospholipase